MTISSTVRIAGPFTGNGVTTTFPFTYKVFSTADVQVIRLTISTGVETTLTLVTDYNITLNGNQDSNPGGNIVMVTPLLALYKLTATSDIANLQPTDLTNQGGFYPEVITDALDRATIQIQQISDIGDRTLKIPISDGALNMELPTAASRANSFLAFGATGLPTVVTAGSSGAPTTITRQNFSGTGAQVAFTLASDPGALGNSAEVFIGGVYQNRTTYTISGLTLTFSAAPVLGTDNIEFVNFLTDAIGSTSADLVTYTPAGTGAVARSAQSKMRDTVSVNDFGAVGDGVADDGNAIRLAVTAVAANGGGQVYLPTGTYKVTTAVGDVSNTAIYVPSNVRIFGASQVGTKIVPGANNVVCFRITGLNGGIENLQIDNPSSTYTSVSGIRLAPTDETQTTTRTDVEFNCITNISIRRVAEAIVLKCGPRVGGADSYCYYNSFTNIDIRNCTLGVWLKIPNGGDPGSGVNRNRFVNLRVGETGTNTGLQIDAGDTNTFVGCSFEGIQSGVSPSATPTAIVVAYNTASYGCTDNKFYGLTIESCTRSVSNINDILEFYGWYDSTNTYNTPAPVGALPLAVDMSRGNSKSLNTVGTTSLVRGTASPATSVDLQLNANGETIGGRDTGSHANQNFSIDISKNVGAYRFNEFKSGTQSLWTWGGLLSSYAEVMRINNPLNANFYFGQNDTDRVFLNGTGYQPVSDNAYTLGAAANRWSVVYAGTGAINTSDEREKQQIKPIDPAALRAWAKVEYCEFKFNNAVALKGDRARWHIGVIAQKVKEAFESEGLDAFTYGLLCYDQWNEIVEDVLEEVNVTLDDGTIVKGAKPTGEKRIVLQSGNRYGIRYEQALALECAYLRSKIQGV